MAKSLSLIQLFASSRNLSARSSSTSTVLPVIKIGFSRSTLSHCTACRNAATAPPASSSITPSTKVVAEVFSKSVIITARISPPNACISELKIVEIALVFEDAYAIILPTGEAQGRIPVSVI